MKGAYPVRDLFLRSSHEKDAHAKEKYLKSGMGKRYIRNRLKSFLGNEDD